MKVRRSPLSPASSRREFLQGLGLGLVVLPMVAAGCGQQGVGPVDATMGSDGSPAADAPTAGWASGGTAAMTGKASYPDPFTAGLASCAMVVGTTEGPCTTEDDQDREDISEGWTGLPVRLLLKVVDADCNPLAGVTVKVWHTNLGGSYSGDTPNPNMCLSDSSYASADFFRGVRTTDAAGVVAFDTCFPGWYRGRCVHVHFQVKDGNTSYAVSQLFFPEAVTEAIFASHGEYQGFGQPDTTFANDNIISGIPSAARERHVFTVAQMADGAMLASKVVTVA